MEACSNIPAAVLSSLSAVLPRVFSVAAFLAVVLASAFALCRSRLRCRCRRQTVLLLTIVALRLVFVLFVEHTALHIAAIQSYHVVSHLSLLHSL